MFSIGRFSKITGVSTKALIWYDKVGLLKPVKVDPENGYRYYNEESFKTLANIHFWQEMDFSVKEITDLSKDIIEKKIKELKCKIDFLSMNINLLEKFQEGNMGDNKLSIFEAGRRLLQGKWYYSKSTTSFKNAMDNFATADRDNSMPKCLYFGDNHLGTDLKDIFNYQNDEFSLKDNNNRVVKNYCYFMVNHYNTLVIFEKLDDERNDKVLKLNKFHVYDRSVDKPYTDKEIEILFDKANRLSSVQNVSSDFDNKIVGKWKMYDVIRESEIAKYDGVVRDKDACFSLSPMFDTLEIMQPKDGQLAKVYVMQDDDEINITAYDGNVKKFVRNNTVCQLGAGRVGYEDEFILCNDMTRAKQIVLYRVINGSEYLFVDLNDSRELDEEIFVYKRQEKPSIFDKWENDEPEFEFISKEELDKKVEENKVKLYLPFGFSERDSDTSSFQNPTIETSLPDKRFVVIGQYCERTLDGKEECIGKHDGLASLDKMLQHHKKIIEYHNSKCKDLNTTEYSMKFYFDGKHYIIPLAYYGNDEELKNEIQGAMRTANVIINDLNYWYDICKKNKE